MNPPTVVARIGDRAVFPDLEAKAFLHHAAISPLCTPVQQAIGRAVADYAAHGAGAFPRWAADREALRRALGRLIGATPEEIALGSNTTRGVSDIALSIPWQAGDRVLLFRGEFPANVTPWQRAAELFGLELRFLAANAFATPEGLVEFQRELERGVRLVAVSLVQFQTGLTMPLRELCRRCEHFGSELFVDAIQGLGVVPFDVRACPVDYLSSGGHKWLLGAEGAGFLYVKQERALALRPYTAGWLSHEQPERFLFEGAGLLHYDKPLRRRADVFETGTSSLLSLAALRASVELVNGLGTEAVFEHVQAYHDALEPELVARGFTSARAPSRELRSGILSVLPPPGVGLTPLATALRQRGIAIGTPDGYLRIAPHFANSLDEVPLVLDALDDALRTLGA